ncbi:MAG TPA: TrmH family RNA methyltransferase [Longimicrobiales bacterium]|nr:TrmH family RNA methyltransferase [Longimicrobiales bacterium]
MTDPYRDNIVVCLHEPQDLINIATAARALMNCGLRRLRLVSPAEYDETRILGIAHNAAPVLERVEMFDTLDAALADALHVAGTSARRRSATYVWQQPREAAAEMLELAAAAQGPVVLLFGREDKGLPNEALDRCDRILTVPTDPAFSSLNLAQAVLLVCYELWLAGPGGEKPLPEGRRTAPPASYEEMEALFADLAATLETIRFYKKRNPEAILRTFRAVYRRADLDSREAKLMRAGWIQSREFFRRVLEGRQLPPERWPDRGGAAWLEREDAEEK